MPVEDIDTISVSEALLTIFARVGTPKEIYYVRKTHLISSCTNYLN